MREHNEAQLHSEAIAKRLSLRSTCGTQIKSHQIQHSVRAAAGRVRWPFILRVERACQTRVADAPKCLEDAGPLEWPRCCGRFFSQRTFVFAALSGLSFDSQFLSQPTPDAASKHGRNGGDVSRTGR